MSRVVVVGSINVDLTTYLDEWPRVGATVRARDFRQTLGGKGANQCVAASRLGASASMIGALGSDSLGLFVEKELCAHAVDLEVERMPDAPTGMALIDVGPGGDNIIRLVMGANAHLNPAHIEARASAFSGADVILLQNEIPVETSVAAAKLARTSGATVIMDPAPAPAEAWDAGVLSCFDLITPNSIEASLFLGTEPRTVEEARDAAVGLRKMGMPGVIITMGRLGVAWSTAASTGHMTAPSVQSVDTVAAGDCFNGAMAAGLGHNAPIDEAIEFASKAAALSTTRRGATASLPSIEEVDLFQTG